jgi:hypothetical protein
MSENNEEPKTPETPPDIESLVQKAVDEQLKGIKEKLDNAYAVRDEALKKVKEMEDTVRKKEIEQLENEGKHREALEMKLEEERKLRADIEKRNTELTRDMRVKDLLSGLEFNNSRAYELAHREIVNDLIQDEKGSWVHKKGLSIEDAIKEFAENEANSFLFKQKKSSGPGLPSNINPSNPTAKTSLFKMSQAEVLKLAAEGKLPHQNR